MVSKVFCRVRAEPNTYARYIFPGITGIHKRYQAVGFPYNRMLKLSSTRGIRIDVPALSVSRSIVDHSVIIQALRKGLIEHEPVILEESLVASPLVQIVWQRLQYLDVPQLL